MTSLLRRKRQTIARSTRPATTPRGCIHPSSGFCEAGNWLAASPCQISIFLTILFLSAGGYAVPSVRAAENGDDETVQSAHYSTGTSGSRLRWLPQRPEAASEDATVKVVQYTQPAGSPRSIRTAQNPISDPFGDKKPKASPAPAEKLGDDLLQQVPAEPKAREPKAQESLPGLPPLNEPAATNPPAEKSYVEPQPSVPFSSPKRAKAAPKQQLLEDQYAMRQHEFNDRCPSPKDLKPIAELNTNIKPSEGDLPRDCPLGNSTFQGRSFPEITYAWTASGLCHKPLYFEDVQLERYGHMAGPFVQPFASAAHFFATFPILPYKMGLEPPNECMYSLGYYRPGDCAPYLLDPLPLSVRGALFEAGGWVAGVCLIP